MAVKHITLPSNITVDINDSRISGVDTTVTSESTNVITSGAVYSAIEDNQAVAVYTINVSNFTDIEESNYTISTEMFAAMKADYHDRNIYPILRFAMESNKDQPSEGANYVDYFCTGVYESNPTYWSFLFISPSSGAWGGTGSSSAISVSWNGSAVSCIYRSQPLQQADYRVTSWQAHPSHSYYPSEKLVYDSLALKANLASPALTGTPTAPTAAVGTSTTQIATTAFVQSAISGSGNLPAVTSSDIGKMLWVDYDSVNGYHWAKNSPFRFGSYRLIGETNWGIILTGSDGTYTNILGGYIENTSEDTTSHSPWSWIWSNYYDGTTYQSTDLQSYLDKIALPDVSTWGCFLISNWDNTTSSYKWKVDSDLYFASPGFLCNDGEGYVGHRFATTAIPYNNGYREFQLDYQSGLVASATSNNSVFSDWSWIKYRSSYSPSQYVTLQDTLDTKVSTTGNETIAGNKTFTGTTQVEDVYNDTISGFGWLIDCDSNSVQDALDACVHKTGDETVGGDKTFTDNIGVVDADHIVYSGGGGGGGFTRGKAEINMDDTAHSLNFAVDGEPKAFVLSCEYAPFNYDTFGVLMVVGDSTGMHGIYNTGSQHNYSAGFTKSYSNGTFTITAPTGVDFGDITYNLVYYYGDGTLTFKTTQIQPGSGVTAVTFTGTDLTEVPAMYACLLESAVNNEQYRRVAGYTNSASYENIPQSLGITFLTGGPTITTSSFSVSYNNGLYINSGGMNAGGYFHNPGTYTLYYLMASDVAGGGSSGYQSLGDELDDIRDTISGIETLLAAI